MYDNFIMCGKLKARKSSEISDSGFGIGFETLDRDCFDPEKCYNKVAALGVKWIRIQSGWCKTEQSEGVYDFEWLDKIVDNLLSRGLIPWLDIGYGNKIYIEDCDHPTGVGFAPIYTERAKNGWKNYVINLADHFKDRITYYEIWNEPDGNYYWKPYGPNGTELGAFTAETARIIRSVQPDAVIFGGVMAEGFRPRAMTFLIKALEAGMADEIDYVTYHRYTYIPENGSGTFTKTALALLENYPRKIGIIQGETGCPSSNTGFGAMSKMPWTEERQAKYLLRQLIADIGSGVKFTSYFTTVDIPNYPGRNGDGDYAYFGILRGGDYSEKPSYHALQNLCALFSEDAKCKKLPVTAFVKEPEKHDGDYYDMENPERLRIYTFERDNSAMAVAYWNPVNLLDQTYDGTISIWCAKRPGNYKLINPLTGEIFDIPDSMILRPDINVIEFAHMPLKEYPLIIAHEDFIRN